MNNLKLMKIIIYMICFVICMFGLKAFDFNRFIKKNNIIEAWVLYFVLALCLTYLLGQFMMSIIVYFNK